MSEASFNRNNFIDQAEAIILENVANEQFGVSELAEAMHTSRSNLLRTIKKTNQAFSKSVYSSCAS
jgi:AraC-like DNA-binding protein